MKCGILSTGRGKLWKNLIPINYFSLRLFFHLMRENDEEFNQHLDIETVWSPNRHLFNKIELNDNILILFKCWNTVISFAMFSFKNLAYLRTLKWNWIKRFDTLKTVLYVTDQHCSNSTFMTILLHLKPVNCFYIATHCLSICLRRVVQKASDKRHCHTASFVRIMKRILCG